MADVMSLQAKISVDGADKAKSDLRSVKDTVNGSGGLAEAFKTGLGTVTGFLAGFAGFQLAGDAVGEHLVRLTRHSRGIP